MSDVDIGLLARVCKGDETAVEALFAEYRTRLVRFALARGISQDDAEDVVQEVFCACVSQIRSGGFRGESSLATWLIGILNHKAADWKESVWKRQQLAAANALSRLQLQGAVDMNENLFSLKELIAAMPSLDRAIILMHETEGWTTDEIATYLRMKPGTVGRHLWQARKSLREQIRRGASARSDAKKSQ